MGIGFSRFIFKSLFVFLLFNGWSVSYGIFPSGCLQNIKRLIINPEYQYSKLSKPAKNLVFAVTKNLERLDIQPANKNQTLAKINDPELASGFSRAIDKLQDEYFITEYFSRLILDTFTAMRTSLDPRKRLKAERGILDKGTMVSVLKNRMEERGIPIVKIEKNLNEQDFMKVISRGAIIDNAFSPNSTHGVHTHLIQQDMTYDTIVRRIDNDYDRLLNFLGTEEGLRTWAKMFDDIMDNFHCPEWIKTQILKPFNLLSRNHYSVLKSVIFYV